MSPANVIIISRAEIRLWWKTAIGVDCEEGEEGEEGQCTTGCSCEGIVIGVSLVYTIFLEPESRPNHFL